MACNSLSSVRSNNGGSGIGSRNLKFIRNSENDDDDDNDQDNQKTRTKTTTTTKTMTIRGGAWKSDFQICY